MQQTGTRLTSCASGASCSASTSQATATAHKFIAYLSSNDTTYPPSGIEAISPTSYVIWSNGTYALSLKVDSGQQTITATSNLDVGPTPYYIEIFNITTGVRIAQCSSGTSCTTAVPTNVGNDFIAFTSYDDITLPPFGSQAMSNIVTNFF